MYQTVGKEARLINHLVPGLLQSVPLGSVLGKSCSILYYIIYIYIYIYIYINMYILICYMFNMFNIYI